MSVTTTVLALLRERSVGRCEMCGRPATNTHHRRPRGMGGSKDPATDRPANLARLCGSGTTGCHGWIENNRTAAEDCGWLVPQGHDPATVPILIMGLGGMLDWVLLDDDGNSTQCCPCGTTLAAGAAAPALAHLRLWRPADRGSYLCRAAVPVEFGTPAADVVPSSTLLCVERGTAVQVEVRHYGVAVSWAMVSAVHDVETWLPELRDDDAVERLRRLA